MNVKLLRKVKEHILEEPRRLYMAKVVCKKGYQKMLMGDAGERPFASCNTAACIAGWACILSKVERPTTSKAQKLLKLNSEEAGTLFFGPQLDSPVYDDFGDIWNGDGTEEEARLAAARIEHFIKTKGRE